MTPSIQKLKYLPLLDNMPGLENYIHGLVKMCLSQIQVATIGGGYGCWDILVNMTVLRCTEIGS